MFKKLKEKIKQEALDEAVFRANNFQKCIYFVLQEVFNFDAEMMKKFSYETDSVYRQVYLGEVVEPPKEKEEGETK